MLRLLFDFVVGTRSNPFRAGVSDSRPSQKNAKNGAPLCGGDASEIKSLGHPPLSLIHGGVDCVPVWYRVRFIVNVIHHPDVDLKVFVTRERLA
jgi:hypothetical protein